MEPVVTAMGKSSFELVQREQVRTEKLFFIKNEFFRRFLILPRVLRRMKKQVAHRVRVPQFQLQHFLCILHMMLRCYCYSWVLAVENK